MRCNSRGYSIIISYFNVQVVAGPHSCSLSILSATIRSPVFMSMSQYRLKKVDTVTSAIIKYDVRLDKYTEQVVERGGCPLSFTEITRFCFMLSDSVMSRCALISPVWRPMLKSPGSELRSVPAPSTSA
uniref:Uncharacterized protein n=1 Tax=Astyanax mexicanus TaxID=7994 RepID=A0A3B1IZW5_ASTMX